MGNMLSTDNILDYDMDYESDNDIIKKNKNTTNYIMVPRYKDRFYEIEKYHKLLSTGKIVELNFTTKWTWGECIVTLTEDEKNKLIDCETEISLIDYHCQVNELIDGWLEHVSIVNESKYTVEEILEIKKSTCNNEQDLDGYMTDYADIDIMIDKGNWVLCYTDYYIHNGCALIPEDEPIEDYEQNDGSYLSIKSNSNDKQPANETITNCNLQSQCKR